MVWSEVNREITGSGSFYVFNYGNSWGWYFQQLTSPDGAESHQSMLVSCEQGRGVLDLGPVSISTTDCPTRRRTKVPFYLSIAEWSNARSDSLSCILNQAPGGSTCQRPWVCLGLIPEKRCEKSGRSRNILNM